MDMQTEFHELDDYTHRERRFLAAWKRGVALAGESYFHVTSASVAEAINKNQLRPDWQRIEHAIGVISRGEAAFLAAMYSFFNAEDGQALLVRAGFPNLCDVASKLDPHRAEVIAELFLTYPGW
ncbi:MAG: hypothetical protein Kow006_31410 [Gammaproteobacteria bacterium]